MDGIEKIIARIEADAGREAMAACMVAREKAVGIRAGYDKLAQSAYEKKLAAGTAEIEQQAQSIIRTAEMDSKKEILAAKQELVSMAFEKARQELIDLPDEEYTALLAPLAAKASGSGLEELVFNKADERRGKKIADEANRLLKAAGKIGKLTVSTETRDIAGGFILKNGDIEVNCSADVLIESVRSEMAAKVAEVIFAD